MPASATVARNKRYKRPIQSSKKSITRHASKCLFFSYSLSNIQFATVLLSSFQQQFHQKFSCPHLLKLVVIRYFIWNFKVLSKQRLFKLISLSSHLAHFLSFQTNLYFSFVLFHPFDFQSRFNPKISLVSLILYQQIFT